MTEVVDRSLNEGIDRHSAEHSQNSVNSVIYDSRFYYGQREMFGWIEQVSFFSPVHLRQRKLLDGRSDSLPPWAIDLLPSSTPQSIQVNLAELSNMLIAFPSVVMDHKRNVRLTELGFSFETDSGVGPFWTPPEVITTSLLS